MENEITKLKAEITKYQDKIEEIKNYSLTLDEQARLAGSRDQMENAKSCQDMKLGVDKALEILEEE